MISKIVIKRIRAAVWYAIGTHRTMDAFDGQDSREMRAAAERALSIMPDQPTIAEAQAALRSASILALSASNRYYDTLKVQCMVGRRILRDLDVSADTLNKQQEKLNER